LLVAAGRGEVLVDEPRALADQRLGLVDALARRARVDGGRDGQDQRQDERGSTHHGVSSGSVTPV
jgi:hypothetical protein